MSIKTTKIKRPTHGTCKYRVGVTTGGSESK